MDYLARREHSRYELQAKLSRKEYPPDLIEETLDRLAQQDLLSDQRFAENFTRHRVNQGYGDLKIRQELRSRGVTDDLVEGALLPWQGQSLARAHKQQQKHFGELPTDIKARAKQTRYLHNRGFDFTVVREVLRELNDAK